MVLLMEPCIFLSANITDLFISVYQFSVIYRNAHPLPLNGSFFLSEYIIIYLSSLNCIKRIYLAYHSYHTIELLHEKHRKHSFNAIRRNIFPI